MRQPANRNPHDAIEDVSTDIKAQKRNATHKPRKSRTLDSFLFTRKNLKPRTEMKKIIIKNNARKTKPYVAPICKNQLCALSAIISGLSMMDT
jgi:hypothetical protein